MPFIPVDKLKEFGVRLLIAKGVPEDTAKVLTGVAVETEAFGVSTHGVVQFGYLCGQIGEAIDPNARPEVIKETGASALIDGGRAFGQLAMKMACDLAAKKAREQGVAMVAVRNSYWIGALSVYLAPLASDGLLAQAWAQTNTCKDCAPFGGIDAKFSTNPVALAFPTGGDPMVADFSTAAMSMGKMGQLVRGGEKSEPALFMDRDGNVTDDPNVVKEGGSILFLGGEKHGYKGYALSLWCEALTAVAGGDCNNPEKPSRQSFNLTVIDPDVFAGADVYLTEIKRFVAHVKSSRKRTGVDEIRLPGERGFKTRAKADAEGVPIEDFMVENLEALAKDAGIDGLLAADLS